MIARHWFALLLLGVVVGCSEETPAPAVNSGMEAQAAERRKAIADGLLAPPTEPFQDANTNPLAYTVDGGRRSDDPPPVMLADSAYSREGAAVVMVTGVNHVNNLNYCGARIWQIAPPRGSTGFEGKFSSVRVTVGGVADLQAFAKLIDFGAVTKIDEPIRTLHVTAKRDRLPQVLPKVASDPKEPHFVRDNLVNLTSWNPNDRLNAVTELAKHPPTDAEQLAKVQEALRVRTKDIDQKVAQAAKAAVAKN